MTKAKTEYTYADGVKSAVTNVRFTFSKLLQDADANRDAVFFGLHESLSKQHLEVVVKGATQKVDSILTVVLSKPLFASMDTDAPGLGVLCNVDGWAENAAKSESYSWKEAKSNGKKKAVSYAKKSATADTIKKVLLNGLAKSSDSPNKETASRIRSDFSSSIGKKFIKFRKDSVTALFNLGVEIPTELQSLLEDGKRKGNKRVAKTFDQRINGQGHPVDGDLFKSAMKAEGEVKKEGTNKGILESYVGMVGNALSSDTVRAEYGNEFVEKQMNNLKQFQLGFVAILEQYKKSKK